MPEDVDTGPGDRGVSLRARRARDTRLDRDVAFALIKADGLCYLRARYYDPETGRFLSRDPLALPQRYAYVE